MSRCACQELNGKRIDAAVKRASKPRNKRHMTKRDIQLALLKKHLETLK